MTSPCVCCGSMWLSGLGRRALSSDSAGGLLVLDQVFLLQNVPAAAGLHHPASLFEDDQPISSRAGAYLLR